VRLSNGKVLIISGAAANGTNLSNCDLYDPSTKTFSATDPTPGQKTDNAGNPIPTFLAFELGYYAVLLASGKVMFAPGQGAGGSGTSSGGSFKGIYIYTP